MKSKIATNYGKFLKSLSDNSKPSSKDTSFQIFYDLFKIREFQWNYKLKVQRNVDYSLSDIFQDIIAHYIRLNLSKEFEVFLEYKKGISRPDILIKKNGNYWAIIEVKTTIGWNRDLVKDGQHTQRLEELSKVFNVPIERIFYIFESSRNVNKSFANEFGKTSREKYNDIFPLFSTSAAPYYLTKNKRVHKKYSDNEILEIYSNSKITDFKDIIKKINKE